MSNKTLPKKLFYVKPKELDYNLSLQETHEHRQVFCVFYDICLTHAGTYKYKSFSCKECKDFIRQDVFNEDQILLQMKQNEKCKKLMEEIYKNESKNKNERKNKNGKRKIRKRILKKKLSC